MKNKKVLVISLLIIIAIVVIIIFVFNKNNKVSTEDISDKCIGVVKIMEDNGLYTYNPELKSTTFQYAGEVDNKYSVKTDKYDVYINKTDFTVSSINYEVAGSMESASLKDFMNSLAFMTAKDKYISNDYDKTYNLSNYVYGNPISDVNYTNREFVILKIYEGVDDNPNSVGKLLGEFEVNFKTEKVTFTPAK